MSTFKWRPLAALILALAMALSTSGCIAAALIGGAAGGYMVAKDMEDGHLIDPQPKKEEGNKGWFGGDKKS